MITEEIKFPRMFDCGIKFPEYKFPSKEYKTGKQDIILPYKWAMGQTWMRFFDGLKEEKIFGTRCKSVINFLSRQGLSALFVIRIWKRKNGLKLPRRVPWIHGVLSITLIIIR